MLIRLACYNLRRDADRDALAAFEERVADDYAAGCLTFGWHSLGTYQAAVRTGEWPWVFADLYAVEGDSPEVALARAEAASSPPGFEEIVEECRSFMAGSDERGSVWLLPDMLTETAARPFPLGKRPVVIRFHRDLVTPSAEPGCLGTFTVQGLAGFRTAAVSIDEGDLGDDAPVAVAFTPFVTGAAQLPPLNG